MGFACVHPLVAAWSVKAKCSRRDIKGFLFCAQRGPGSDPATTLSLEIRWCGLVFLTSYIFQILDGYFFRSC